jgi:hypothetical protein
VLLSRLAPSPASYEWLFEILVGRTPAVSWAAAGELPAGCQRADQFAVLPAGGGRGFVVSLAARRGTVSALTSYNALRTPRMRLARRAIALGLRAGLAQPLLATRIDVGTVAGAPAEQLADALLTDYLRRLFRREEIVVAFGGGSGPYRKPVLQVFGGDGVPLGYVKVGWNGWSRAAVRREAAALAACAAAPMSLGVPALLDHCEWRGLDLVVTAPLPAGVRRMSRGPRLPDTSLLREIAQISPGHAGELAASPWWRGVRARIAALADPPGPESWLVAVADRIEREHGETELAFGRWHGDLVPWNLARLGRRIYAWDWESSSADAPVGFDALHFHFQVAFVERREPLEQAAALAATQAGPALRELGVSEATGALLAELHLLELAMRHEEARASTGDCDDRFYPAVAGRLRATRSGSVGSGSVGLAAS